MDLPKPRDALQARAQLDAFEEAIQELWVAYAKYFTGVDRVAPVRLRDRVQRQLRLLESEPFRTAVLRFRLDGLRARFNMYKQHWVRVELEIERGVFRKDTLRFRQMPKGPTDGVDPSPPMTELPASEAPRTVVPPPPKVAKRPAQQPEGRESHHAEGRESHHAEGRGSESSDDAGLDPRHMRDVFSQLVKAKRAAGESLDGLTYAALCRKLAREAPKIRERHKCAKVRFEVSTVRGKVLVLAHPADSPEEQR